MKQYQADLRQAMGERQAECDAYNETLIEDGKRQPDREWRGTLQFTFKNRATRRHDKGLPPVEVNDAVREPRCPCPSQHRKGVVHA